MLYKEAILRKGGRVTVKKLTVVLQGREGGVLILARSGIGVREGVLEARAPEQCVEGWVGIVQEESVTAEAHSGPERGRQRQRQNQDTSRHPRVLLAA